MATKEKKTVDKRTVLIVDDTELNRALLRDILEPDYEILEAASGLDAVGVLTSRWAGISLVLLDVVMPGMDGFELLSLMNRQGWLSSMPVIMISADGSADYIDRAFDLGVTDYITRPFDEQTVRRRCQNTINLYAKQKVMENMVTEQIMEKERSNFQMVEILSNVVEFRNGESGLHVRHVRAITDVLLQTLRRRCPQYGLTATQIALITNASALHDIGKISIDEKILNKPSRLTPEEFEIMKTHTITGAQMLEQTPQQGGGNDAFLHVAHDICRWHHERYDGRGYPDGLKGEEIPIAAQVVALADVYDALTATRVYKPAYPPEKAMEMILGGECGTFNPLLLECLQECAQRLKRELDLNSNSSMSAMEIRRVTSELLSHGELTASGRALNLLEQERSKSQFYNAHTQDIFFEYDKELHQVVFSDGGAKELGLPSAAVPLSDQTQREILGEEPLADLLQRLSGATYLDPDIQGEYTLALPGGSRKFRLDLRTLWGSEEHGSFAGIVGKLTPLGEG